MDQQGCKRGRRDPRDATSGSERGRLGFRQPFNHLTREARYIAIGKAIPQRQPLIGTKIGQLAILPGQIGRVD